MSSGSTAKPSTSRISISITCLRLTFTGEIGRTKNKDYNPHCLSGDPGYERSSILYCRILDIFYFPFPAPIALHSPCTRSRRARYSLRTCRQITCRVISFLVRCAEFQIPICCFTVIPYQSPWDQLPTGYVVSLIPTECWDRV